MPRIAPNRLVIPPKKWRGSRSLRGYAGQLKTAIKSHDLSFDEYVLLEPKTARALLEILCQAIQPSKVTAMMTPMKTQIEGAAFLAARSTALLADEPRVGKTGAALLALNKFYRPVTSWALIVTTSSGRAVWRRAVKDWLDDHAEIVGVDKAHKPIKIVSWDQIRQPKVYAELINMSFDVAILDEDHRAKNPETKTAQAVYGKFNKWGDRVADGLVTKIPRVWHLTGTPCPHDLGDMWCRLRSSAPHLLGERKVDGRTSRRSRPSALATA